MSRRLVVSGVTARLLHEDYGKPQDELHDEGYHEVELYKRLISQSNASEQHVCDEDTTTHTAQYLGSFPVEGIAPLHEELAAKIRSMKECGRRVPVLVLITVGEVKICRPEDQCVRMACALRRISYVTCERSRGLFALVAREPRAEDSRTYCHVFATNTPEQALRLHTAVGDAFRMALARQQQATAPLWSGAAEMTAVHAPSSLPLAHKHYPRTPCCNDRSPASSASATSPSSSEESCSPQTTHSYRRLGGERAPLMRRLARGFTTLHCADDDSVPLVTDTPTTPTNPLCLNEGYVNEAGSEAEARTRESNREPLIPRLPVTPRRQDHLHNDLKQELRNPKKQDNKFRCDASARLARSGNNNEAEEALREAPWFQAGIPREIALEVLERQPVGTFLVRCSSSAAGSFALSLRVPRHFHPRGIAHYLIQKHGDKYKIKGFTKEFSSLSALVTHHSVMPELLPCPLWLSRCTNNDRDNDNFARQLDV